jgi:MtfA peptidase
MFSRIRAWRRQRAASGYRVDADLWTAAEARLPFLDFLPEADRPRLRQLALEFLAEKEMTGAQGFRLTDSVRLGIALQACLPILNLGLDWYRGWVGVIVYPGDFVIPRETMDAAGVVHKFDDAVLGEAWEGGPVLLSWFDAAEDAEGINVVIHEFAHKLDMLNGEVDGVPPLHEGMSRSAWVEAFANDYRDFRAYVERGGDTWLDPYAAEHPSEFFAVAAEAFFETPLWLKEDFPAVYEQLQLFFRQDPALGEAKIHPPQG